MVLRVADARLANQITSAIQHLEAMPSFTDIEETYFKSGLDCSDVLGADVSTEQDPIDVDSMWGLFIIYFVFAGCAVVAAFGGALSVNGLLLASAVLLHASLVCDCWHLYSIHLDDVVRQHLLKPVRATHGQQDQVLTLITHCVH
jgi:hypothetical protein